MYLDKADFKQAMSKITRMLCIIILGKGEKGPEETLRKAISPQPSDMLSDYDVKEVMDGAIASAMEDGLIFEEGDSLCITPEGQRLVPGFLAEIKKIQTELGKK